jgi:hypothetical protein
MTASPAPALAWIPARPGQPADLEIRPIGDAEWVAFAQAHPDATAFHHPAWAQAIATTYGFRAVVLGLAAADGRLLAGLPVMMVRRKLKGTIAVALPYTDYIPPLARDPETLVAFSSSLMGWMAKLRMRRFDIHSALGLAPGLHSFQVGVRHLLSLEGGEPRVAQALKNTPVDRAIRKAQREGVQVRLTRSRVDLEAFYRLHWQTRRRLGVPVQPRRFIEAIWSGLVERQLGFACLAYKSGQPIAGALFLNWNRTLTYKYGASDARFWSLRPNNVVMWSAIQWACANDYRLLDLGRSDVHDQGLRDYKSRWGATEVPLVYSSTGPSSTAPSNRLPMRLAAPVIRWAPPLVCRGIGELFYGRLAGSH